MLPGWQIWPLLAVIIWLVIGGAFGRAASEPNPAQQINTAQTETPTNSKEHKPSKTFGQRMAAIWDRTWEDAVAFYTLVLSVFTALLTAVSGVQGYFLFRADRTARLAAEAAKESADAARDTVGAAITANQIAATNAEQQLRAYVTAFDVDTIMDRQRGTISAYEKEIQGRVHTYRFSVILKNGGQTPAINARINTNMRTFRGGIPADFDFPSSTIFSYGLIGPQIEWRTPYQDVPAGTIEDETLIIALWGWIEYDDIFATGHRSTRHRTEFCYRIDRHRRPSTNELWMGFNPAERFNAMDKWCMRPIDPATGRGGG